MCRIQNSSVLSQKGKKHFFFQFWVKKGKKTFDVKNRHLFFIKRRGKKLWCIVVRIQTERARPTMTKCNMVIIYWEIASKPEDLPLTLYLWSFLSIYFYSLYLLLPSWPLHVTKRRIFSSYLPLLMKLLLVTKFPYTIYINILCISLFLSSWSNEEHIKFFGSEFRGRETKLWEFDEINV